MATTRDPLEELLKQLTHAEAATALRTIKGVKPIQVMAVLADFLQVKLASEQAPAKARVISHSKNTNSFGLTGSVIVTDEGQGWQAAANSINIKPVGHVFTFPSGQNFGNFLSSQGYEIPQRLRPDFPQDALAKLFPPDPAVQVPVNSETSDVL